MTPKISILTVTNRHGGIDIAWSSLRRQSFTDWEWILYDTLYPDRLGAVAKYTKGDPRVKHLPQEPKDPKAKTWLNHAQNQAFLASQGELIVLLQDYIAIKPDALEKFWVQHQQDHRYFVSGVGHQYGRPGKDQVTDPEGLITVFDKPFEGRPELIVWSDPRKTEKHGSFYPCMPPDWEANWAMCPRSLITDIGGWDESFDMKGHAWDNVSIAERAFMLGYEPYLDQTNESFSIRHEDFFVHELKQEDPQPIAQWHFERLKQIREGKMPVKLPYLDNYRLTA